MNRRIRPCGTEAAYQWHRKRDEPACDGCKAAHSKSVMAANFRRGLTRGGRPWARSRPYYDERAA
jgi:hypothetical protein